MAADDREGEVDGLGAAGRDEDLVRAERDAVVREVAGHGLPELQEALGRAVGQDGLAPVVEGVHHRPRGRDVGVADVEVEDLDAAGLGRVGVGLELADGRGLDVAPALRNVHG